MKIHISNPKFFFFFPILFFNWNGFSQIQDIDDEHTNYYEEPIFYKDEYVDIYIKNIAAQFKYLKFQIKMENISSDYLIYNSAYSNLIYPWGEVKLEKTQDWFLKPSQSINEVYDFVGDTRFIKDTVPFTIKNVIRVPAKGEIIKIPDTELKTNQEILNNEHVKITIEKVKNKPKRNSVKIKIENVGDNYLYINPDELATVVHSDTASINNDPLFANREMIKPGEDTKISLVYNLNDYKKYIEFKNKMVKFNNFLEIAEPVKLDPISFEFAIDRMTTYKKNK